MSSIVNCLLLWYSRTCISSWSECSKYNTRQVLKWFRSHKKMPIMLGKRSLEQGRPRPVLYLEATEKTWQAYVFSGLGKGVQGLTWVSHFPVQCWCKQNLLHSPKHCILSVCMFGKQLEIVTVDRTVCVHPPHPPPPMFSLGLFLLLKWLCNYDGVISFNNFFGDEVLMFSKQLRIIPQRYCTIKNPTSLVPRNTNLSRLL